MRQVFLVFVAAGIFCFLFLLSCASPQCPNLPLVEYNPEAGYRFENLARGENNTDSLFVCLTFSGGGIRAGSLAYGVLCGLKVVNIDRQSDYNDDMTGEVGFAHTVESGRVSLLDELDVVSSVSGGSFTAQYYNLFREEIFSDSFKKAGFLQRNLQWDIISRALRPDNLIRLPFVMMDRIDVAAQYYDDNIFREKTYEDIIALNRRPFTVVNSTNMSSGQRFEFTQEDFDILGSDLGSVPVGWSVAASSAFPLIFSPLRLRYWPGAVVAEVLTGTINSFDESSSLSNYRRWSWVHDIAGVDISGGCDSGGFHGRDAQAAGFSATGLGCDSCGLPGVVYYQLDIEKHKYLYLMDGGVSDNIGLGYIVESFQGGSIRKLVDDDRIRRLVVIVVDAGNHAPTNFESNKTAPGLFMVGYQAAMVGIETNNKLRIDLLKALFENNKLKTGNGDGRDLLETYFIYISIDSITDPDDLEWYKGLPTSLKMPKKDVDKLILLGIRLLKENVEYQRLINDLITEESSL